MSFHAILKSRFRTRYQSSCLNGTSNRSIRDSGLEKNEQGHARNLYFLRQTHATLALLLDITDTLSRQTGNATVVIERRYHKLAVVITTDMLA